MAERLRAQSAARLLLAIRLLPPACALFIGVWSAPAYAARERFAHAEMVGFVCLALAFLGILAITVPMARGLTSVVKALRYFRLCRRSGRIMRLPGERSPALVIEGAIPFFAIAGIVRPRLVVSVHVLSALSAEQLAAAVRHERAHRFALDNLKRLAVLLAPDLLPFFGGFGAVERAWVRFTEWAADDCAAAGNSRRSLCLAEALVRVARLGVCQEAPTLTTPLLTQYQDLAARVNRLVEDLAPRQRPRRRRRLLVAFTMAALSGLLVAAAAQPVALNSFGRTLDQLHRVGLSNKGRKKGRHRRRPSASGAVPRQDAVGVGPSKN
jgi:beta-lactamase regulating signal transducer with metallopeptidase domain